MLYWVGNADGKDQMKICFYRAIVAFLLLGIMAIMLVGCRESADSETKESSGYDSLSTSATESSSDTAPDDKSDKALETLRAQIVEAECNVGLAFVGYINYADAPDALYDFVNNSGYEEKYPFLKSAAFVDGDGAEVYAVVPSSANAIVTVYASQLSESGEYSEDRSSPIFTGEVGQCVIVRCNVSEIFTDVLISVSGVGEAFEFRPMLSLKDGHIAETAGVFDFSAYSVSDGDNAYYAYELLCENPEIQKYLELGMSLVYTENKENIDGKECMIFALGTDHDDSFVNELFYAVSGESIYSYDVLEDSWKKFSSGDGA